MIQRLNGWQRLWVLISVLYGIVVIILTISYLPSETKIRSQWAGEILDIIADDANEEFKTNYSNKFYGYSLRNEIYKDLSDDDIISRTTSKPDLFTNESNKKKFDALRPKYGKALAELPLDIIKAIGVGLFWWIIPIGFLYVIGASIAWVIKGFTRRQ